MTDIYKSILAINPNAVVTVSADNVDLIQWHGDTTPISKEDILAKQAELQADYDAKTYQRSRAEEYPSIEDQFDDLYHNGIEGWRTTIQAIKDKYPKE